MVVVVVVVVVAAAAAVVAVSGGEGWEFLLFGFVLFLFENMQYLWWAISKGCLEFLSRGKGFCRLIV